MKWLSWALLASIVSLGAWSQYPRIEAERYRSDVKAIQAEIDLLEERIILQRVRDKQSEAELGARYECATCSGSGACTAR